MRRTVFNLVYHCTGRFTLRPKTKIATPQNFKIMKFASRMSCCMSCCMSCHVIDALAFNSHTAAAEHGGKHRGVERGSVPNQIFLDLDLLHLSAILPLINSISQLPYPSSTPSFSYPTPYLVHLSATLLLIYSISQLPY